jgi:aspartate/methionine/tyrosine aminotransferase
VSPRASAPAGGDPPRLSRRLTWDAAHNRLTEAIAARDAAGLPTIDLTVSNPTTVGIPYPAAELADILRRAASPTYPAHPLGLPAAREALAAALSKPGDPVSPADLVLTASTSEAYSHLFKLFADPGGEVLTAVPTYPLLDDLAALDGLALHHFPLEPGRRFALDPGELARALTPHTRLLVVVHPGNPTGAYLTQDEQDAAAALCAAHRLPLISDEVFADYPLVEAARSVAAAPAGSAPAGPAAARSDVLAFSLGGLSKSAGLPGFKLGWIRLGGPGNTAGENQRRRTLAALERIADTYLSVATPVQRALPDLLSLAPGIRAAIAHRLRTNLAVLRNALAPHPALALVEPEGGWSAVLRVPHLLADEDLALDLLRTAGVLVHPGHFFDFPTDGYLVLSLLPAPTAFAAGVTAAVARLCEIVEIGGDTADTAGESRQQL